MLTATAVDSVAFVDPAVYDLELERVFTRSWHVLAPVSMLGAPGDFVTATVGEDPIVVVRQADGGLRALLNSCRHRGMPLCTTGAGRTTALVCPFHGWRYDLAGRIETGHPDFDLVPMPRVEIVGGVVVGTWDADAGPCPLAGLPPASARAERAAVHGAVAANWKVVAERALATGLAVSDIPPILVERVDGGWWLRTIVPRGPDATEVVGWLLSEDGAAAWPSAPAAVTDGLDLAEGVVAVSLRSAGALPDGCPHDDEVTVAPPRPITATTTRLYERWAALLDDDRPLAGLPACR